MGGGTKVSVAVSVLFEQSVPFLYCILTMHLILSVGQRAEFSKSPSGLDASWRRCLQLGEGTPKLDFP